MASKRMFSIDIVGSDAFMDMPIGSQLLYFHLGMESDDDGFIGNPKKVMRSVGCKDDDLKVLISKKFVLVFESGVIVIKHHRMNNNWDSYNCKRTVYLEELSMLKVKENKSYTLDNSQGLPVQTEIRLKSDWNQSLEENRIEENRIEENRIEENRIEENRIEENKNTMSDAFNKFWSTYPKRENKRGCELKWKSKKLDNRIEEIISFIGKAKETDRWKKGYIKAPLVFLNQEAWNDDLSSYNDVKIKNNGVIKL